MSKWGATDPEPGSGWSPWGIPGELLRAAKSITDPVHGDIYVNALEQLIIDSPPMQRLRRVRQLGTTHLVYPGAVQTRFSHSLGTLRAAQDLLDAVADNHRRSDHQPDLFDEWEKENKDGESGTGARKFAEATVLARLGALMHDLCHVPIGHTIEDDLGLLDPHDKNVERFEKLWGQLDPKVREVIDEAPSAGNNVPSLKDELQHLILSKVDMPPGWESSYPFVEDIVGNTICADLIDYLQRDHYYTGLPMKIGHRFVDHFYVTPKASALHKQRMVVRTSRDGQRRQDVVTELEKYLRYRYELTERVLTHHAKTSADAMIGKLLEMWDDATWRDIAGEREPAALIAKLAPDADIDLVKEAIDANEGASILARRGRAPRVSARDGITREVKRRLEDQFLGRSDDGILEHLIDQARLRDGERWDGIGKLATAVINRQLFKRAARADSPADLANAEGLHKKFGSAAARRRLEQDAARVAGVNPGWKIVIWLPSDKMRMKVAKVLVDDASGIAALADFGGTSGEIVEAHRRLWAITVYVEPHLATDSPNQVRAMLGYLRDQLNVAFHDNRGQPIVGSDRLALDLYSEEAGLTVSQTEELEQLLTLNPAASGATGSFVDRLHLIDGVARKNQLHTVKPRISQWASWGQDRTRS
ncbi:HD domain-containing protein [Jatrophihabitans sp.]|jgi:HD superfamily phosphohydrolase|uniref:HD domain-containing protein n=1 Tax=Jatrophihabitans sp. TaxID=1932789 RepID=UPI002F21F062